MISIVIPLYNKAKSIERTIQSVLDQSYADFELIVVNDGSTDNSLNVVQEYVREKCKVYGVKCKIISQDNAGVSAARNRGIKEAKGEYVAFLDGDDVWETDYLEAMARLINDYPNASLYGLGFGWIRNGERIPRNGDNMRGVIPDDWTWLMRFWTSTCCAPKKAILEVGLFNESLSHGEDLDMWWRLMLHGTAVFDNTREFAYYVQDAENRAMHRVPSIDKHVVSIIGQYAEARKNNDAFRKAFDTQMIYFLYEYLFTPYKKEAQRLAALLDYTHLKRFMSFRMKYPYLYRALRWLKE